jgi:type I restriction enzyme M protein
MTKAYKLSTPQVTPQVTPEFLRLFMLMDSKMTRSQIRSTIETKSEIVENEYDLSINRYKEIVYEEVEYDTPDKIIADIKALDKERTNALEQLEKLMSA